MTDPFNIANDHRDHILSFLTGTERWRVRGANRAARDTPESRIRFHRRFEGQRDALAKKLSALRVEQAAYEAVTVLVIAAPGHPQRDHYLGIGQNLLDRVDRLQATCAREIQAFDALAALVPVPAPPLNAIALQHQGQLVQLRNEMVALQPQIAMLRVQVQARLTAVEDAVDHDADAHLLAWGEV